MKRLWLVLLASLAVLTAYRYYDRFIAHRDDPTAHAREYARSVAKSFNNTIFPRVVLREIITDSSSLVTSSGCSIVILMSRVYDCNPCTIRELRHLDSLFFLLSSDIRITGIFLDGDRTYALMVRKVSQVSFPLFYGLGSALSQFNPQNKFPLLFLLKHQVVDAALFPIPSDPSYSLEWIDRVMRKIKDGC